MQYKIVHEFQNITYFENLAHDKAIQIVGQYSQFKSNMKCPSIVPMNAIWAELECRLDANSTGKIWTWSSSTAVVTPVPEYCLCEEVNCWYLDPAIGCRSSKDPKSDCPIANLFGEVIDNRAYVREAPSQHLSDAIQLIYRHAIDPANA